MTNNPSNDEILCIKSHDANTFDVYAPNGTYFSYAPNGTYFWSVKDLSTIIKISARTEDEARSTLLVKLMSGDIVIKPFTSMKSSSL